MKKIVPIIFLFLIVCVLIVTIKTHTIKTVAAESQDTLQQALAAYAKAQDAVDRDQRSQGFQMAERLFKRLVDEVEENPDLYANLGTVALQAEHLGPAILAFRRALRLDPDHPRALQNVQHARTLLPAWVPRPSHEGIFDTFFFWHHALSPTERSATAALAFLLAALGVAVAIRWKSTLARNLSFLPALVWLSVVASLLIQSESPASRQGVIIADETIARAADSNNAPSRFAQALPAGTEVEVLEKRQNWVKIVLANGRNAWVRDSTLGMVGS